MSSGSRRSARQAAKQPTPNAIVSQATSSRRNPLRQSRNLPLVTQPLSASDSSDSDSGPQDSSMLAVDSDIQRKIKGRSVPLSPARQRQESQESSTLKTPKKATKATKRNEKPTKDTPPAKVPSRRKIARQTKTPENSESPISSTGSSTPITPRNKSTRKKAASTETSDLKLTPAPALSLRPKRTPATPNPVVATTPAKATRSQAPKSTPAKADETQAPTPTPPKTKTKKAIPPTKIGVSAQPTLPCREAQYEEIWSFLKAGVEERDSRCLYVSGVPGTGKTLVVKAVLSRMQEASPDAFKSIFVNSLSLGTPERIWSRMHKALGLKAAGVKGRKVNGVQQKVEQFLCSDHLPLILVVDELDQLLDKRQSILYTLLEWTSSPALRFSLIAIFNTMNLPETALAARNSSRMGFNRVVFAPYTHQELQRIVTHHLGVSKTDLLQDALILLARKVAGISGDARRAIEIANRTLEIIETNRGTAGAKAIQDAFRELFSSPHIHALKAASKLEREVIRHLAALLRGSGSDSALIAHVVSGIQAAATFEGNPKWTSDQILGAISRLFASRLVLIETWRPSIHSMITLGVAVEDVNYALGLPSPTAHED